MDNRNPNYRKDNHYTDDSEQRYSYEQQRAYNQRSSRANDARYRTQKRKRLILVCVLGAVLVLLWLVAAISIVKTVFEGEGEDDGVTTLPVVTDPDSTPDTEPGGSQGSGSLGGITYITRKMEQSDIREGSLILVNSEHKYIQPNVMSDMVTVSYKSSDSYIVGGTGNDQLKRAVVEAMNEMFDAAAAEKGLNNYFFGTPYGYCTTDQQASDYEYAVTKHPNPDAYEFKAGESEHETGYAFEIRVRTNGTNKYIANAGTEYKWIYENCYKYGIIYRYPSDKADDTGVELAHDSFHCDHFRYVGKAAAAAMHENNWCLEDLIDWMANKYTYEREHLMVTAADGTEYEMYYYPAADEGSTDVPIPAGMDDKVEISGDNIGGFIVTVQVN